ncbi:hypothetical protein GCM10011506_22660 [Marivirga lumbricoides]|uniref:Phytase-like domain-containing protein n=1 Tax=Marivirga lumbricoides TaxID=1046115 RepID=A0ABQ1M950_9BACT|nr:hypothetical protein GCM10011506_22660 [Marivirga lumbricoides]
MRKKLLTLFVGLCFASALFAEKTLKSGFVKGNPEIKSINALSFGPEGILFVGDSKNAMVYALDTQDEAVSSDKPDYNIERFDEKIAALMGTTVENITINDIAINPISKNIYVAITHSSGKPALLKLTNNDNFEPVDMTNISYSGQALDKAVAADAKDGRGRSLRMWAISDLNYSDGQVMLTGLSNQEFGSTFRSIPFPFNKNEQMSSLEIYHAAHGRYETDSPVKSFTTTKLDGKDYIVASYTCTPLVVFPTSDLKPGQHVKGRTVAELGNWNTPLDMIIMEKDNESYLLMANSARAVMKIKLSNVADFNGSLTEPVEERSGTAGVDFIALPFVNVQQLEKLDDQRFVMLQRKADGNLTLWTSNDRWL